MRLHLFVAGALALVSGLTYANDDRSNLLQQLAKVDNLQAEFTQTVTDANGSVVQELSGNMALARPALLYWETAAPDDTIMVADGDNLWYYNPFVEQVSIYSQVNTMAESPLLLLLNPAAQAWDSYEVSQNGAVFTIMPLPDAAQQQQLQLTFSDAETNAQLQQFVIDDGQGQISTIVLSEQQLNGTLARDLFTFTPPPGVVIDDQRQPSGQ